MLPTMLTLWGVVTACQGTLKTYHGLLACRFFLGLSSWYFSSLDMVISLLRLGVLTNSSCVNVD